MYCKSQVLYHFYKLVKIEKKNISQIFYNYKII
jgi:hypothetical protein